MRRVSSCNDIYPRRNFWKNNQSSDDLGILNRKKYVELLKFLRSYSALIFKTFIHLIVNTFLLFFDCKRNFIILFIQSKTVQCIIKLGIAPDVCSYEFSFHFFSLEDFFISVKLNGNCFQDFQKYKINLRKIMPSEPIQNNT